MPTLTIQSQDIHAAGPKPTLRNPQYNPTHPTSRIVGNTAMKSNPNTPYDVSDIFFKPTDSIERIFAGNSNRDEASQLFNNSADTALGQASTTTIDPTHSKGKDDTTLPPSGGGTDGTTPESLTSSPLGSSKALWVVAAAAAVTAGLSGINHFSNAFDNLFGDFKNAFGLAIDGLLALLIAVLASIGLTLSSPSDEPNTYGV